MRKNGVKQNFTVALFELMNLKPYDKISMCDYENTHDFYGQKHSHTFCISSFDASMVAGCAASYHIASLLDSFASSEKSRKISVFPTININEPT